MIQSSRFVQYFNIISLPIQKVYSNRNYAPGKSSSYLLSHSSTYLNDEFLLFYFLKLIYVLYAAPDVKSEKGAQDVWRKKRAELRNFDEPTVQKNKKLTS